jgi:hypothetical protein
MSELPTLPAGKYYVIGERLSSAARDLPLYVGPYPDTADPGLTGVRCKECFGLISRQQPAEITQLLRGLLHTQILAHLVIHHGYQQDGRQEICQS